MSRNFTDEYIRRQFYTVGLSYAQSRNFIAALDETNAPARAVLQVGLPAILAARSLSKGQRKKIDVMAKRLTKIRGKAIADFRFQFERELRELVGRETAFDTRQFESLPATEDVLDPPTSVIAPALLALGLYDGRTVGEWFAQFVASDSARIKQAISAGISNGLAADEIVTSLIGSKNLGFKNGALNASRHAASTLARTIWNGVANGAHKAFGRANSKLIAHEVYSAVLDGKTTFVCASLDGKKYPVGKGPYPPLHRNCRSHRYPVPTVLNTPNILTSKQFAIDAKRRIGGAKWDKLSPVRRTAEIAKEKARWTAQNIGTAPASETWTTWFARQPAQFKRDYLGRARYKAYVNGNKISSFVAPSGRPWTIEQLKKRGIV